jgi:hypothetical protein
MRDFSALTCGVSQAKGANHFLQLACGTGRDNHGYEERARKFAPLAIAPIQASAVQTKNNECGAMLVQ